MPLLPSRSTRLAATLILAVLLGWGTRAWRLSHQEPSPLPRGKASPREWPEKTIKNSFHEE